MTAGYSFGSANPSLAINAAESTVVGPPFNPIPSRYDVNGFIGGGEIGYNYQLSNYLVGLETDFSLADERGSASATGPIFIGGTLMTTFATKLEWLGTVRGRLGFLPTENLLLYATGGFAYGAVRTATIGANVAPGITPCNGVGLFIFCAAGQIAQLGDLSGIAREDLPTPNIEKGKDELVGYLRWAGKCEPRSFLNILGKLLSTASQSR